MNTKFRPCVELELNSRATLLSVNLLSDMVVEECSVYSKVKELLTKARRVRVTSEAKRDSNFKR